MIWKLAPDLHLFVFSVSSRRSRQVQTCFFSSLSRLHVLVGAFLAPSPAPFSIVLCHPTPNSRPKEFRLVFASPEQAIVFNCSWFIVFCCEYNSVQRLLQSWPAKLVFKFYAQHFMVHRPGKPSHRACRHFIVITSLITFRAVSCFCCRVPVLLFGRYLPRSRF